MLSVDMRSCNVTEHLELAYDYTIKLSKNGQHLDSEHRCAKPIEQSSFTACLRID
jgi:hypothetical protein